MPQVPIIMPQLGESIAEAAIINYLVKPGDTIEAGQDLIEVETNKATMTVTAPCTGRVTNFSAQLNDSYIVGAVLGQIEATAAEAARLGFDEAPPVKPVDPDQDPDHLPEIISGSRVEPTVRGLPVTLDPLLTHRKTRDPKPGPALYALRALALALSENSAPAGRLVGSKIVLPSSIDVGFAVEAEDGVLVPVLRGADKKPLAELVVRYNELVELARQRKLPGDATGGSVATVTNFGTFGLVWATPIPLPEQTIVLGMGAGRRMPHWDEAKGQFVPVMEAYLTLSFDHRVLDGGAAGRLLQRIAALMQKPEAL